MTDCADVLMIASSPGTGSGALPGRIRRTAEFNPFESID